MDFLDPKKRRSHAIRLMIGYCLLAIALLLASVLLLFMAFGYGINRTTGEVTQNGLVFVDAHPEAAEIYLNGVDKGQTDGRFVFEAGKYNIELRRDGYRTWKRDFILEGGNIVRLVYPFMFPTQLQQRNILAYTTTPDMVTASPDRRWIMSHVPDSLASLQLTDTSVDALPTTTLTLPAQLFAGRTGVQRMQAVEWSTNNRHVLVKYSFDGGYDYLILDRERPNESLSVSQVFGKPFTKVTLRDKSPNQFYLYDSTGGVLLSGKTTDKTTTPVATEVVSFWPYKENIVLYNTHAGAAADKTIVKLKDGTATYTIRELSRATTALLNIAEFDGDEYMVTGSPADGKVYIYKNALAALKKNPQKTVLQTLLMRLENPEYVSFSANARFIAIQAGAKFDVYDLEAKQQYKYDTALPLAARQEATWMDGHRLLLQSASKMHVFDFDGTNKQTIVDITPGFVPLFDRDYNQLFTVGPSVGDAAKFSLVRTDLNLGTE